MQIDGKTINNSYIVQEKVDQNPLWEIWTTKSVYSPNTFLLCFLCLKESEIDQADYMIFRHYFCRVFNLQHPCLYHPFDLDVYNDRIYIALESKEGVFLQQFLDQGVTIPFHVALHIIIDLLQGLQELQRLHSSHNLLSPWNIWLNLTPEGIESAQICDYFLFPLTPYLLPILKKEEDFSCYLSPALMGSEQLVNSPINDMFSIGVILYRLLTGKYPAKVGTGKPAQFLKEKHNLPDGMAEILSNMLDIKAAAADIDGLINALLEIHSCIKEGKDDYMRGFDPSRYSARLITHSTDHDNSPYFEELETVEEDMVPAGTGTFRYFLNRIKSFFRKRKKSKTGIPASSEVESSTMRELSERKKTITFGTITGDMGFMKDANPLRRLQKLFAALKAHYIYDKATDKSLAMDQDTRPRPKSSKKDEEIRQEAKELYEHMPLEFKKDMAPLKEPLHSEKTGGNSPLVIPEWDREFMNLEMKKQERQAPLPSQPSLPQHQGTSEPTDTRGFLHWLMKLLKKAFCLLRNIFT